MHGTRIRSGQEAKVVTRNSAGALAGGIVLSILWFGASDGSAQTNQPPPSRSSPGAARAPDALPGADRRPRDARTEIVAPPPILAAEVRPIDLATVLRLANVQNPELNAARQRILEAAALRQLAAAYFLPSINPGMNFDSHSGVLQQSNGNILSLNRSAVFVGAGSNAVAAGTVSIPGVYYAGNVGSGLYSYFASKQIVSQREYETVAIRNQMLLQVATAYSELLRAEGRRAARIQARDEARVVAKFTADYANTGLGRIADANRAATVLANWEASIQAAEAEILTASARLCQLLNLDPSIRLHPTDAVVVPQPLVPDPIALSELIALGLLRRPELAAQRAAIEAALLYLAGAKILPFSPTTLIGFSAGGFGGGSNLVRPIFGGFSGREDLDVIVYWTIQNLGLGNIALIRQADARLRINQYQQVEILNMVRADIAEAYARTHARYAQIGVYEEAVRSGYLAFKEDLDRTMQGVGEESVRPSKVLPIELLNSFTLLADARIDYLDAIIDYNESQFAMYVALGQPPADALARPVPTEGVQPHDLPPGSYQPGTISPLPIPATPEASQQPMRNVSPVSPSPRADGARPTGLRPRIPTPATVAAGGAGAGQ
jgi:outer membrane protein TolC